MTQIEVCEIDLASNLHPILNTPENIEEKYKFDGSSLKKLCVHAKHRHIFTPCPSTESSQPEVHLHSALWWPRASLS